MPAIIGTGSDTSKGILKDRFSSRVTVRDTMGSEDTFFKTNSMVGPPGFIGGTGPDKETTSSGFWSVIVGVGVEAGVDVEGVGVGEDEQAARRAISAKTAQNNRIIIKGDFRLNTFIISLPIISLPQSR